MNNLALGLKLMGYGLGGVFLALVLFYLLIRLLFSFAKKKQ
ncbi:MAG TPA: OadG-related small transporter subunit [Bacillota bacterium]|nr:OadG-related small transporter subunit [Bacillota bacterium]HQD39460.1 OadG-related small transporter subunit [Bacillota bacterium]